MRSCKVPNFISNRISNPFKPSTNTFFSAEGTTVLQFFSKSAEVYTRQSTIWVPGAEVLPGPRKISAPSPVPIFFHTPRLIRVRPSSTSLMAKKTPFSTSGA